jgi:hypothetical protein
MHPPRGLAEMHFPGSPHQSYQVYFLASELTLSEKAITQSDITLISIEDQLWGCKLYNYKFYCYMIVQNKE